MAHGAPEHAAPREGCLSFNPLPGFCLPLGWRNAKGTAAPRGRRKEKGKGGLEKRRPSPNTQARRAKKKKQTQALKKKRADLKKNSRAGREGAGSTRPPRRRSLLRPGANASPGRALRQTQQAGPLAWVGGREGGRSTALGTSSKRSTDERLETRQSLADSCHRPQGVRLGGKKKKKFPRLKGRLERAGEGPRRCPASPHELARSQRGSEPLFLVLRPRAPTGRPGLRVRRGTCHGRGGQGLGTFDAAAALEARPKNKGTELSTGAREDDEDEEFEAALARSRSRAGRGRRPGRGAEHWLRPERRGYRERIKRQFLIPVPWVITLSMTHGSAKLFMKECISTCRMLPANSCRKLVCCLGCLVRLRRVSSCRTQLLDALRRRSRAARLPPSLHPKAMMHLLRLRTQASVRHFQWKLGHCCMQAQHAGSWPRNRWKLGLPRHTMLCTCKEFLLHASCENIIYATALNPDENALPARGRKRKHGEA